MVFKKEADFGDESFVAGGQFEGTDEILTAVAPQHTHRQLAAGENDGFGEVLEHEAEGRSRVGHGVGAVQNHKAVVVVVFAFYAFGNIHPEIGGHVRGIDDIVQLTGVDSVGTALQLWHQVVDVTERKGF